MNSLATRTITAAALIAAFGTPIVFAGPASASHGGGSRVVQSSGTCAHGGVFKLKAKHDDARIEIEYEVDTNRVGQVWHVKLTDNGHTVFDGNRRTTAPSGSFEIQRSAVNRTGADSLRAHATFGVRSCGGHVTL
jgi:hypothetical protein